jgi:hypothetical protein
MINVLNILEFSLKLSIETLLSEWIIKGLESNLLKVYIIS